MLNHPDILTLHDLGTISAADDPTLASAIGAPYLVSELLVGRTLRQRLGSGALSLEEPLGFARQILAGLAAAHDKGIVHRDLKPENLFLTDAGPLRILDSGLAKLSWVESNGRPLADASTALATESGLVAGTVGYMSPEQIRGGPLDARSDLFSFGLILFEMLTGLRAFRRETAADPMSAILTEEPPPLASIAPHLPPGLQRFLAHCLGKNVAKRSQSARDAAFALEPRGSSCRAALSFPWTASISRPTELPSRPASSSRPPISGWSSSPNSERGDRVTLGPICFPPREPAIWQRRPLG